MDTSQSNSIQTAYSKQDLLTQLEHIGIRQDMILEVHCALKQVGFIVGGAQSLIDALKESAGTIVMPCQCPNNTEPLFWENPPIDLRLVEKVREGAPGFDPYRADISAMGALAENLRLKPGTIFSNHPNCAFMANGKDGASLMENQPLHFPLGKGSPLDKMYHNQNSYILLIGTGYEHCTALHLAEYLSKCRPIFLQGGAIKEKGQDKWKKYMDCMIDSQEFPEIGKELEKEGIAKKIMLGNASCIFMKLSDAVNYATLYLTKKYGGV